MKKKILLGLAVLGTIGTLVGVYVAPSWASDEPPIVQEVRHQGEVLDNHEDRITNNEEDIKDLQSNTNTPPSTNKVIVREVVTPKPEPQPQPDPVTVSSYSSRETGSGIKDTSYTYCDLIYSDGSSHSFLWQERTFNQVWITSSHGRCDNTIVGREKADNYTGYQ